MEDQTGSDLYLLGRVAAGDRQAFAVLLDRHSPAVLGLLVRMLGTQAEAEEVLQEVFLQVWQDAKRFRPDRAAPRGWLLMMARSRGLDRLRSREAGRKRDENFTEATLPAAGATQPIGTFRLEGLEQRHAIQTALAELPETQRSCIELAFFEGLSYPQISDRLEVPLSTVKSRVLAGMGKLRVALSG